MNCFLSRSSLPNMNLICHQASHKFSLQEELFLILLCCCCCCQRFSGVFYRPSQAGYSVHASMSVRTAAAAAWLRDLRAYLPTYLLAPGPLMLDFPLHTQITPLTIYSPALQADLEARLISPDLGSNLTPLIPGPVETGEHDRNNAFYSSWEDYFSVVFGLNLHSAC